MARWLLSFLIACQSPTTKLDAVKPRPDEIPLPGTAMKIDAELVEPAWNLRAQRGVFTGTDGKIARPYSEIRLLADAENIYVALYAADEDIEPDDAFEVELGGVKLRAAADGTTTPAVKSAIDRDGTLGKPGDDDEEWVVELAVPRGELADRIDVRASRCDTPKDRAQRCGSWSRALSLPPRR
jgi:hypothetical protein